MTTSRTLAECDDCGLPHILETREDGTEYLVGVNECSRCGATAFTALDEDALGVKRPSSHAGKS